MGTRKSDFLMCIKSIIKVVCMQWEEIWSYGPYGPFQPCFSLLLTVFSFSLGHILSLFICSLSLASKNIIYWGECNWKFEWHFKRIQSSCSWMSPGEQFHPVNSFKNSLFLFSNFFLSYLSLTDFHSLWKYKEKTKMEWA